MFGFVFCLAILGPFSLDGNAEEVRAWKRYLQEDRAPQTRSALLGAYRWAPKLKQIFRKHGLPEDLVWIALVESGFHHNPTSPSGAQGMFQFKRATARAFGLDVDANRDDRDEPLAAAEAAATYLVYLSKKFASWELVLAAYNLGEGDLRRAMAARNVASWQQIREHVRKETRDYIPKVKAAALIGNRFLVSSEAKALQGRTIISVNKGDTLFSLAKRYNRSVASLQAANNLNDSHIFIGQNLVIPR